MTAESSPASTESPRPELTAVVVHWHNEQEVAALAAGLPPDPRFELIVVDNSGTAEPAEPRAGVRWLHPGRNLGFGPGANLGIAEARGHWVMVLNPDIDPKPGAWAALLESCDRYPDADGLAPALVNPDGSSQCRWQLQPLPSPWTLVLQTAFLAGARGPALEPEDGAVVEQPAAAALALRREVWREIGGFDDAYFPAWFEDVDLAKRLAAAGKVLRYTRGPRFEHSGGGSVPTLGYGRFLWIYYRNLQVYLRRHHGRGWVALTRLTLPAAAFARLLALPLRRPRRAASRGAAASGLWAVICGVTTGWRRPAAWAATFTPPRGPARDPSP